MNMNNHDTNRPSPIDLLPPPEIIEAAEKVRVWMEANGYKNWQLGGVCDRRFATHATDLIKAKGRYHTQIAYEALRDALGELF